MPPSLPNLAAKPRPKNRARYTQRASIVGLLGAMIAFTFAGSALADSERSKEPVASLPAAQMPVIQAAKAQPAARLPQTRYTVRKQIESIEPISWLESYGTVRVRDLKK